MAEQDGTRTTRRLVRRSAGSSCRPPSYESSIRECPEMLWSAPSRIVDDFCATVCAGCRLSVGRAFRESSWPLPARLLFRLPPTLVSWYLLYPKRCLLFLASCYARRTVLFPHCFPGLHIHLTSCVVCCISSDLCASFHSARDPD